MAGKGLFKTVEVSDELYAITGKRRLARTDITKAIWDYIKENDLQDDDDRRVIHPDQLLSKVLGKASINMMKMQSKLSAHITNI